MLTEKIQPSSLDGIKRLAKQIKKETGLPHHQALNSAAQSASYENFKHAQSILKNGDGEKAQKHYLYLTVYWSNQGKSYKIGRETLKLEISKPLLELYSKAELKACRGLGWFRVAASDHMVNDTVPDTQESARKEICRAAQEISFMEGTGLRPSKDWDAEYPKADRNARLPNSDHTTCWHDPQTGQFILIDEPYMDAVVNDERRSWAIEHNWHLEASKWAGMYYPYNCSLFAATKASDNYNFESLMHKIDALPEPLTEGSWSGISVNNHDIFTTPSVTSPNDIRRAKAKGTILRLASKKTIPYTLKSERNERKPNGSMPIPEHQKAGAMIKALLHSEQKPWRNDQRMNRLRSTLQDWLSFECGDKHLQGSEFFQVYYGDVQSDNPYLATSRSNKGRIKLLKKLKGMLEKSYPNCEPLRKMTQKIDTSISIIQKYEVKQN